LRTPRTRHPSHRSRPPSSHGFNVPLVEDIPIVPRGIVPRGAMREQRTSALDDMQLVSLARDGDPRALEELMVRHQGVVYRYLVALLGDEDVAADAAQETFVRALANLNGFRGDAAFRTWLLAIARNEGRGWARRTERRRESPLEGVSPVADAKEGPDVEAVRRTEVARVRAVLDRLPEKQRLSVSLRIFDGLSFREVAEATDSTEGAARVNYHHGIRRLREWLDE
jgi:RNA polymerase sigma-70 factor, ECF subfamily